MRIGVHAKALTEPRPTGVAVYAREMLQRMLALPDAGRHTWTLYTDANNESRITNYGNGIEEKILRAPFLWTQARLAWELFLHKPDVLFTPQHVLPLTAPARSVVTIHGLEYERLPQCYPWRERMYLRWVTKDAVQRAARVIAVSEATKRDLVELYGVPEEKIVVIHHGAPILPNNELRITNNESRSITTPYFLYIGRIEKKKNVDGIIRAFEIAKEKHRLPHALVLAGGVGYGGNEIRLQVSVSRFQKDIQVLGYINDEQKWLLLKNADAFPFPSWYEGFGLPILEAQAAGTPVITSPISAMSEVAGDGALFANPAEPESIAEAMAKLTNDATLKNTLIEKGRMNLERFSWERCAKETLDLICKI